MKPLDSLGKRDLLAAAKFDAEEVREYAREFLEQERYGEAFEFFWKLRDDEGLATVKSAVIRVGDPEVLWRIEHRKPEAVSAEDWKRCANSAMSLEKFRSAAYAFGRAGDEAGKAGAEKRFSPPSSPPEPAAAPRPE
jgi:hypothetical protein